MNSRHWKTLISALDLQQQLHDGQLVIVDCRSDASDADAGYRAYQTAHLPGAVYAHLNHDLSGPITSNSGRHPLPDIKTLSTKLGSWGIDRSKQVIAYDADNGAMAAARLWWLLRWLGHERVAVLDGGIKQWQASGFELVSSSFVPSARNFMPEVNSSWVVDADTVAARATQADWCVLDARAPERFAGEVEPLDAVAGHVPGARNHFFVRNLDGNGRFLPASKLREQFTEVAGEVAPHQIINMCGSGVTACHNLLAMEVAGLHGARLYAGSWSEWTRQHRPVATGK
jgi:thiosulfate/3-mercaptopyruvate sulfurtransferase